MLLISIPYQAMLTLSYTLKASKYSATCILVTTCPSCISATIVPWLVENSAKEKILKILWQPYGMG